MPDVQSGTDLNSYQGNANLAGGNSEGVGYAKVDITPLQTLALQQYNTNMVDYQQQQYDRAKLEDMYLDPSIYVDLDQDLAGQITPKMQEFKDLARKQLEKNPNSEDYYKFKDLYKELGSLNAKGKAVQTLRQQYKKAAGETQDEHEKEALNAHLEKLSKYKLGDEIPVYNKYFGFDKNALPPKDKLKGTYLRVKGNVIETVQTELNNPMGLDEVAKRQRIENPKVYTTGEDIGHTLLQHGGVDELNKKTAEYADLGIKLNVGLLKDKYQNELNKFQKENPTGTFQEFLNATGHSDEIDKIRQGHDYLKVPVKYIPVPDGEGRLQNYSYSADGKQRLNVDNDILRAKFSATDEPIGKSEKVLKSELSKTPAEIERIRAATEKINSDKKVNVMKANQTGKLTDARVRKLDKETSALAPLPDSAIPLIGQGATLNKIKNKDGSNSTQDQITIRPKNISPELAKLAGFNMDMPTPPKYTNDRASNIQLKKTYDEQVSKMKDQSVQMRFYGANGNDETDIVIRKIKQTDKGANNIEDITKFALLKGKTIKFIDQDGNVLSTNKEINIKTQIQNNKVNAKGDQPLGADLPIDDGIQY